MNAYLVSHNGLGDNLFMVGALRHLATLYENVYFLCKQCYYSNVVLFFTGTNIHVVPFDEKNEWRAVSDILTPAYATADVFVCGCHKNNLKSKITNPAFKPYRSNHEYTIDHDTLTTANYNFIESFYEDIGLDLACFYEQFWLPSTPESKELYESIRQYRILFVQLKSSNGYQLNLTNLLPCLEDPNILVVCNDQNVYPPTANQWALSQQFVMRPITHYVDTIQNCAEIYLVDSCFTGLVLPYLKTKRLKATKVRIILRHLAEHTPL
jgi:hypothetical protein